MSHFRVTFDLQEIHCIEEADGPGNAEPYLWTVFFKIDGDTVQIAGNNSLQGTATVVQTSGTQNNLGVSSVGAGDTIQIPAFVGHWETIMQPIVKPGTSIEGTGTIGCLAVLMEEDDTPLGAIVAGYNTLVAELQKELDALIPTLNPIFNPDLPQQIEDIKKRIGKEVKDTIKDKLGAGDKLVSLFGRMDDQIGSEVFRFGGSEIDDNAGSGIDFDHLWDGKHGKWEIRGHLGIRQLLHPQEDAPDPGEVVLG